MKKKTLILTGEDNQLLFKRRKKMKTSQFHSCIDENYGTLRENKPKQNQRNKMHLFEKSYLKKIIFQKNVS